MRIGQIVATYQQQALQRAQAQLGRPAQDSAIPGLDGAKRTNQARLTDAGKGFMQATAVRDGVAGTYDALDQARGLVEKAKDTTLSAADRKQLQSDFTKALAAAEQGVKDQRTALADQSLGNTTYDAKRVKVQGTDQLGRTGSAQFASVADLKKLDLGTATPDRLSEAAKVLDTARSETKGQLAAANVQGGRAALRYGQFQAVQDTLTGTSTQSARQQRDLAAIQALSRQSAAAVTPGTLFNAFG